MPYYHWLAAQKKYGGAVISLIAGPGGPDAAPTTRPDLSIICDVVGSNVEQRNNRTGARGYVPKVRDSCPLPCCQYLHTNQAEESKQDSELEKVIIRRIIHTRRRKKVTPVEGAPAASDPAQAEAAAVERQRQEEEDAKLLQYQQQQAEEARQEKRARQQQLEEQKRQQAAAAEAERQQAAAEQQAAAARVAPPAPAAPTQKIATFQNTGTDPTMAAAELYYESTRWGPLGHGDPPVSVGSFPGHRWFIVANGVYAKQFTVGEEDAQTFTI